MGRPPPRSTRTATLFPYATRFRSAQVRQCDGQMFGRRAGRQQERVAISAAAIDQSQQRKDPVALIRNGVDVIEDQQRLLLETLQCLGAIGENFAQRQLAAAPLPADGLQKKRTPPWKSDERRVGKEGV